MKAYIIKVTYIESGNHFFIDRDNLTVTLGSYLALRDCYETERAAKMVATKMTKADAKKKADCDAHNAERVKNGLEPFEFFQCVYEPYAVEVEV
jgi:hypothetical protein